MPQTGSARSGALWLACVLACEAAGAQPALQPSAAASAAERAQKESDRAMYWIRVVATKPAPVKVVPAPKPVAASALAPARPATEAREKAMASPTQTPVATASLGTAPTTVGHASYPAQAPVGGTPEPRAPSRRGSDSSAAAVANTEATSLPGVAASPAREADPGLIQIRSVQPEFPTTVVERLHKGHVEVRFEVEPGGTVVDATVVESSSPRLNSAALEAVNQWRFRPTAAFHTALVDLVFDIDKWN